MDHLAPVAGAENGDLKSFCRKKGVTWGHQYFLVGLVIVFFSDKT